MNRNFLLKNKKAAMEMSVGTIVTIVLLMSVLILGIFLVQKIFSSGSNAIDSIGTEVESEIQKLFSEEGNKIAIYPTSRDLIIKKGDDPKGFAFDVMNKDVESADFSYEIMADDVSNCGSLTKTKADSFLIGGEGSFSLGPGNHLDLPRLVKLDIPETAPPCTIIYTLEIKRNGEPYTGTNIFVTIK
jgi:hypothetical protein